MPKPPRTRQKKAATLADVGRAAGVSAMAASAVLNGTKTSARISDETREKIERAAAKLNYRPNVAARALVSRRMNTIGVAVVVHDGELNHYFLELFNGVIEGAARRGQNTTVFTLEDWSQSAPEIERFCDGRIDGMLLIAPVMPADVADELPAHTPFVSLHANVDIPYTVNLESDEQAGAQEMVEALIRLGHRDILHISGPRGLLGAERRIRGYQEALRAAGIEPDPARLLTAHEFTRRGGLDRMSAWLREEVGRPLPTAIFCANDAIGIGCLEALAALKVRVPEDLSICGFDDTLAARTTVPQLATVRQPLRAMGVQAVEVLLARIEAHLEDATETAVSTAPVVFQTELVLRDSIAPPPATVQLVPAMG